MDKRILLTLALGAMSQVLPMHGSLKEIKLKQYGLNK